MNFFSNRSHLGVSTLNIIKDVQVKDEMWRQSVFIKKNQKNSIYWVEELFKNLLIQTEIRIKALPLLNTLEKHSFAIWWFA